MFSDWITETAFSSAGKFVALWVKKNIDFTSDLGRALMTVVKTTEKNFVRKMESKAHRCNRRSFEDEDTRDSNSASSEQKH